MFGLAPLERFLLLSVVLVVGACKDDAGDKAKAKGSVSAVTLTTLTERCDQLAKICGDTEKHVSKIAEQCKQAATVQVEKGCGDKVLATYDCFEKELCGRAEKVWSLADFDVLSERQSKCLGERGTSRSCTEK